MGDLPGTWRFRKSLASKNVATWAAARRLRTIRSAMVFRIWVIGNTSS